MTTLRDELVQALADGRTVAQVCAVTSVPRHTVIDVGRTAGLRFEPSLDRFRPSELETGEAAPRTLAALVRKAEASDLKRTRALAVQARTVILELERAVLADAARRAAGDYPVSVVRRWAREQGLEVPARGRYLPAHIVQAWRLAGEPGADRE